MSNVEGKTGGQGRGGWPRAPCQRSLRGGRGGGLRPEREYRMSNTECRMSKAERAGAGRLASGPMSRSLRGGRGGMGTLEPAAEKALPPHSSTLTRAGPRPPARGSPAERSWGSLRRQGLPPALRAQRPGGLHRQRDLRPRGPAQCPDRPLAPQRRPRPRALPSRHVGRLSPVGRHIGRRARGAARPVLRQSPAPSARGHRDRAAGTGQGRPDHLRGGLRHRPRVRRLGRGIDLADPLPSPRPRRPQAG